MKLFSRWPLVLLGCILFSTALAQPAQTKPGLLPYAPTRIEWLALMLNSQHRRDATVDSPFNLNVVNSDHETVLIFVRYHAKVDREIMNMAIDTARDHSLWRRTLYGGEGLQRKIHYCRRVGNFAQVVRVREG